MKLAKDVLEILKMPKKAIEAAVDMAADAAGLPRVPEKPSPGQNTGATKKVKPPGPV